MMDTEARELRAVLSECLDPLYAARLGNIERHIAIEMAVGRLQGLDASILGVMQRARECADARDAGRTETMDSRPDTYQHIQNVQRLMGRMIRDLMGRAERHDQSKLVPPEVAAYDELTPRLAGLTYGSDEYRATLREMKPAIAHHYAANSHHPEHYPNGIQGMSLLDLVEMLTDWKAASMRHNNGDFRNSIAINQERFGYSDELKSILLNTLPLIEEE